jgi:prophage regulatory protein
MGLGESDDGASKASDRQRRLLRLPEVIARVGLSRSWVYAEIAGGRFPNCHKVGRASCWDSYAIDAWIAQQLVGEK